ncbi:MAG TPA: outer membrane protein assembly factor BamA [Thermoanaerobaculia bacterium]
MTDTPQQSPHPHHRSARERQRRGPMWGCLKGLVFTFGGFLALLVLVIGAGWWYLGTTSFAGFVMLRIEKTLEARLGRKVSIHDVQIIRARPAKIFINDLRIANAPGAVNPYFATVRQIEVTGGVDSFWGRTVKVTRVDVRDPHLYFEVFPAGSKLVHNFPHWQTGPKSKYDIYHLDIGKLFVTGGAFQFLDRRHDVAAAATDIRSEIDVTSAEDLYSGIATSPRLNVRIQNYKPFDLDLRGGFRFTPDNLTLNSIALRGRDMQLFVSGPIHPLSDAVYNLHLTAQLGLNRVREIFAINKVLDGVVALDTNVRGRAGSFAMSGGWVSPKIAADVYDLTNARGKLNVTDNGTTVDVDTARYGGGTLAAHYVLPKYAEPYPQTVDLHYNGVSLEKLFNDWGIKDTGLRGGATGHLAYQWNKDKVLAGSGNGTATLSRSTTAFSSAKYPIPLGGAADFALDNGTIKFSRASLTTGASTVNFNGSIRIADVSTDLAVNIHSTDFAELDKIGFNFAHSAGKKTYELLGLGGSGDISGTIKGRLKEPQVTAHIAAAGTKFNNDLLGNSDIQLRYDGVKSVLTFDRATFSQDGGRLAMTGTIAFPDRGPSPLFDLAIDANNYPAEAAMNVVKLPLKGIHGTATGRMLLTGTPDSGKATFANLLIARNGSEMRLKGFVNWLPGKGTTKFDLDLAARNFPIADAAEFLDLGTALPVTGELTGTLHLEGTKANLQGAGAVTVRKGILFGEPVESATAELQFTQGKVKISHATVTAPAGTITAEGELNLNTNQFTYTINSASLDLSKLQIMKSLAGLLGGKVTLTSSGGGTFDHPELFVEATLTDATLKGLALPAGSPPPKIYFAIHNGRLVVRGNIADIVTIEGDGTVGAGLAVDGVVHITVPDVAKLVALSPSTASLPASGNFTVDLKLGGKLTPLEALVVDGTFPVFNIKLSDHDFTAAQPLHVALRNGRISFESFELTHPGATLAVTGYADITGKKALNINVHGGLEAALLQVFVHDLRAEGHINIAAGVTGTLADPRINGSAEMQDAQFRVPGFPQMFDHVTGTVVFRGDRIDIDSLRAQLGGGTIVAGGSIALNGVTPASVRLSLQGTDVAIRYFEGITIDGNFTLLLTGDKDRMNLGGDVHVNRALYSKDFDFGTAFLNVVLSRRSVTPIAAASWQDKVSLRLHITAPQTLAVRNNIADVTGSADLDVQGTLANPVILGVVNLDEGGTVKLQGNKYQVTRGSITFQNPFRIDPYFDITLEGRVSSSGFTSEIESRPMEVTINLVGTIDRFTPTITSDPPASDITLFSLLGFGGLMTPTAGRTTQGGVTSTGASIFSQSLGFLTSKILPFADTFTFNPDIGNVEDPGQKVTFEKTISNDIRVLVIYNLSNGHKRSLLEWQVNPEWSVQLTDDELRSEWRLEARYRRSFAGQWHWAGNGKPVTMVASLGPLEGSVLNIDKQEPAPPVTPTGPVVARVTYRADANFDTTVLGKYISVIPGEPLSLRGVQSSIKSLYGTGDFRDIHVETNPATNGEAEVVFVLSINYRVTEVKFDGLGGADRDREERDISVRVGDVLSLNAVERSAVAVTQFLNREGYLEATVDPETNFSRETSSAQVIFHVTTGARAKVGTVTLDGDTTPFAKAELIAQMRRGPGKAFRVSDARLDALRMERFMFQRDYRKAEVRFVTDTYDPKTKTVALRFTATAGPIVRIMVTGVPRSDVRRELPFSRNQGYSEDVIDNAADAIVKSYQERGYINATVDTESHLDNNVWTTTFKVVPGQQFKLSGVTFTGNKAVSAKDLQGVVQTSTNGGFRSLIAHLLRRPTGVTRAQLSADRDAIESYYRLHGFSEATVATPVVNTDAAKGTMTVDFPITEGPQTIVKAVRIEGNEQVPSRDLPKTTLKTNAPLDPTALRNDLVALETYYAQRGNAEVQITPRPDISADKTSATMTYVIAEGPKIKVGDVVVRGNTYTKTNVILRKAGIDTGDPFSYIQILEAQRELYQLGIFQRVDIQPEQTGTAVSDRNVVIQVEEGKDLSIGGTLGASKQTGSKISPIISASIAHRNLFGTARYLGLQYIKSSARSEEFLTYQEPFIGRFNVPAQFTIFHTKDIRPDATVDQRGASLEITKVARLQTRWSIRYEYRIGNCQSGTLCDQAKQRILPGFDQSITDIDISAITPTFFWDRRDDPIDPHRGFFTTALLEYAFPVLHANADFFKQFAQASYYIPVSDRSVFAVSSRVGFIEPRGTVPFTERFVGGGETSHRAYSLDLLGDACTLQPDGSCNGTLIFLKDPEGNPTKNVAPIGGNSMFITNLEYRFPIFSSLGGAVFTDVGNVFPRTVIHFNDLRYGVGTGIRYLSPVGPLRFDVGYKLHRRDYEKPFAFFVTLGYAF